MNNITLSYGSGGSLTHKLVVELFASAFKNEYLDKLDDSAIFRLKGAEYAYTTDSFVVDPIFFPGGDIGKLAVCGAINDLASCGAQPMYLTTGFILEEGLSFDILKRVVFSMAREARKQNVSIVAGDTKVVPKGKVDKIFINTSGIGIVKKRVGLSLIRPGDKIIINGNIGMHGLSILLSREGFSYKSTLESDCNSLWGIVKSLLNSNVEVHFMRDPTRGGVSAVVNEISIGSGCSISLFEDNIPIKPSARHLSEILGLEPLDIANEGKMLFFIGARDAAKALGILKKTPLGRDAAMIGEVTSEAGSKVYLHTLVGGRKILGFPVTEPIPRIC